MALTFNARRWLKYAFFSILVLLFISVIRFVNHQTRFQKYMTDQYITWDDFPPSYSEALKAKDWDRVASFDAFKGDAPAVDHDGTKTIPPIIHFIWFQNLYETHEDITSIPSKGSEAPQVCIDRNPDFTVNIWNRTASEALLREHYSWFMPTYDAYTHPIQKVDAVKYFLLWHYGGIYMDMDIACRRSLAPLLPFPAWFPEASPLGVNNDLMATRARHPVVELMINSLTARNRNLIFPYLTIFWSTGPQFTGDMLKRWFLGNPGTYKKGESKKGTDSAEWFVLPMEFYSEEFTFFGHSPGGTWHEGDVAVVLWFVAHPVTFWFLILTVFVAGPIVLAYRWRARVRADISKERFASEPVD